MYAERFSARPRPYVALLHANRERRFAASSGDRALLSDSTGVITTDSNGRRILHIPRDFRRKLHGFVEDELRDLFGIEYQVHYDEIEGADHLPYALLGQGGVYRDNATVSEFQEKSESDQLSWLLLNSFIITYTSGDGEADESEVDESSGQIAAGCASSSTTSLVVAEDEGASDEDSRLLDTNECNSRPTSDEDD